MSELFKLVELAREQQERDIQAVESRVALLEQKSERAMSAFTARIYDTLSNAPLATDGLTSYAFGFISNGRKTGEGAGVGTGVLAYYDPDTDSWLNVRDDSAVQV